MIAFKNVRALDDWSAIHPMLREVVLFLLDSAWPSDRDLIVTRIAERDANQVTEVHTDGPPNRAIDFRISHCPYQTVERAAERVNSAFQYDPTRPGKRVAILHDAGTGSHLHVQVHGNTLRRIA